MNEASISRTGIIITTRIAEYFDLIETVSSQVDKLVQQALKSAIDNLEYARNAEGQNQVHYVLEAKNKFMEAVAVEENENKIVALCGLSLCWYFLGKDRKAKRTARRIKRVKLSWSEIIKAMAKEVGLFITGVFVWVARLIFLKKHKRDIQSYWEIRILQFETVKSNVLTWVYQMIVEK